jgi:hypothetical protein
MTAARNLILPSSSRQYIINNNTTGGFALTVKGSATSGVTMINGEKAQVFWNGSDYAKSAITTAVVNGIVYINSSGQAISGSALTFDGTNFATTGTATAAKLIPTGTSVTGNGMYLPATNSVGISTAGTNAVYIDASQNVGIGTSSPTKRLTASNATDTATVGNNAVINVQAGEGATINSVAEIGFAYRTFSGTNPLCTVGYQLTSNAGTGSGALTFSTRSVTTDTAPSERMRITSAGNVGIGTNVPSASAILDAQSTTKGVRMPNMTTTQKNAISSPAAGLVVFDTTLAKLCVYSGSAWETVTSI